MCRNGARGGAFWMNAARGRRRLRVIAAYPDGRSLSRQVIEAYPDGRASAAV